MPGWDSRRSRQIFSDGRPAQPPNRAATVVLANQPNMRTAHRLIKVARPSAEAWALERPSPKGPNPRGNRRQGDSTPGRARWVVPVACWIPSLSQPEGGHFSAIACPGRAPVGLASGGPAPVLAARVHAGAVPRPAGRAASWCCHLRYSPRPGARRYLHGQGHLHPTGGFRGFPQPSFAEPRPADPPRRPPLALLLHRWTARQTSRSARRRTGAIRALRWCSAHLAWNRQ